MLFVTDNGVFKVKGKMESGEYVRISLEIGFEGGIESSLREISMEGLMEIVHWFEQIISHLSEDIVKDGSVVSTCS